MCCKIDGNSDGVGVVLDLLVAQALRRRRCHTPFSPTPFVARTHATACAAHLGLACAEQLPSSDERGVLRDCLVADWQALVTKVGTGEFKRLVVSIHEG